MQIKQLASIAGVALVVAMAMPAFAEHPAPPTAVAIKFGYGGIIDAQGMFTTFDEVTEPYDGSQSISSAFELAKAEAWIAPHWGAAQAELRLESVRSGGEHSSQGIAENSLVLRVNRAWAGAMFGDNTGQSASTGNVQVGIRAGLIAHPWFAGTEFIGKRRDIATSAVERYAMAPRSDMGAMASVGMPHLANAVVSLSVLNGEGLGQREQNNGKGTVASLQLDIARLPIGGESVPLRLALLAQESSIGQAASADHRLGASLFTASRHVQLGVTWMAAEQLDARGTVRPWLVSAHADTRIWRNETLAAGALAQASTLRARGQRVQTDATLVGWVALPQAVRAYAGVQILDVSDDAGPLAGVDEANKWAIIIGASASWDSR